MNDLGFINDRLYSLNQRLRNLMQPFCGIPVPQTRNILAADSPVSSGPTNYLNELNNRLELAAGELNEANELLNWLTEALGQDGDGHESAPSAAKAFR